jgi:dihydroxyacetone kinase-like protein
MTGTLFNRLVARFEGLEAELNSLDAATGDGDHGTTILKGLRAAAEVESQRAKAFRTTAGGASGSLFSRLVAALENTESGAMPLGQALAQAADQISQLGDAKAGDKTMLDALIPAAEAATAHPENAPRAAAEAARTGANATTVMAARRGRARYVEHKGAGHIDAGAVSVAELLEEFNS